MKKGKDMENINLTLPKEFLETKISEAWLMTKAIDFTEHQQGFYSLMTIRALAISNMEIYEDINLLIKMSEQYER